MMPSAGDEHDAMSLIIYFVLNSPNSWIRKVMSSGDLEYTATEGGIVNRMSCWSFFFDAEYRCPEPQAKLRQSERPLYCDTKMQLSIRILFLQAVHT